MQHDTRSLDEVMLARAIARMTPLLDRRARRDSAAAYAEIVRDELRDMSGGAAAAARAADTDGGELGRHGCHPIGRLLTPTQTSEVCAHLAERPCFPGHVARVGEVEPTSLDELRSEVHHGAYAPADVLAAPHLLELANRPDVLAIAADYLGCTPSLYSINCFWSFSGHAQPAAVAQRFHRDPDDLRFCTLFAFLTDVDAKTSPHSYVIGSHDYRAFDPLLLERARDAGMSEQQAHELLRLTYEGDGNRVNLDPYVDHLLADRVVQVTGPAGTCFIEDTYGLHKGTNPSGGDRLVFWARYGLGPNLGYWLDRRAPLRIDVGDRLPRSAMTRYINRLVVQW